MTFDYVAPGSVAEACELLERGGPDAHALAGGTALMLLYKQGLLRPEKVVGLSRLAELRGVRRLAGGGLWLGAMTTHRAIEAHPDVAGFSPALAKAFASVATIRIRNQATIGGNLAHADPAQDPPPMLLAFDAEVEIAHGAAKRALPLGELFRDVFETALSPGELIVGIRLPPLPTGARATYLKFLPRTEDDYATVSVAARVAVAEDGRCSDARVCLGSVGSTPVRSQAVERALVGQPLTDRVLAEAAALVVGDIDPFDDVRGTASYKRRMAEVCTRRALAEIAAPMAH